MFSQVKAHFPTAVGHEKPGTRESSFSTRGPKAGRQPKALNFLRMLACVRVCPPVARLSCDYWARLWSARRGKRRTRLQRYLPLRRHVQTAGRARSPAGGQGERLDFSLSAEQQEL